MLTEPRHETSTIDDWFPARSLETHISSLAISSDDQSLGECCKLFEAKHMAALIVGEDFAALELGRHLTDLFELMHPKGAPECKTLKQG